MEYAFHSNTVRFHQIATIEKESLPLQVIPFPDFLATDARVEEFCVRNSRCIENGAPGNTKVESKLNKVPTGGHRGVS
jgi:hypothetical protein